MTHNKDSELNEQATSTTSFFVLISPSEPDCLPDSVIWTRLPEEALHERAILTGFLLRGLSAAEQLNAALSIRRSPHWATPVFIEDAHNESPLLDGTQPLDEAIVSAQRMHELLSSLKLDMRSLLIDEKIMLYQYIRDPHALKPALDRCSKHLYRYPVIDVLSETDGAADNILTDLLKRRVLIPKQLLDRTRECPHCSSAHPHFIDVCPHCESIDIHKAQALHCFTCGHVGPETDFQTSNGMTCPQCNTKLRHIGVDYDRPLTQYACQICHHVFIEPNIKAKCLDCGAINLPEELIPREISTLVLSAQGRTLLRSGTLDESFVNVKATNFVVGTYFRYILDWSLTIQERHPDIGFGLVLIDIKNAQDIFDKIGVLRGYALFDEVSSRIGELLRNSDLATRFGEYGLWIFLPMSSAEGFVKRLEISLSEISVPQISDLQANIQQIQCPRDIVRGTSADDIMAILSEKVKTAYVD